MTIKLPRPRNQKDVRLAREKLSGAFLDAAWLPEGVHPEVDEARAMHVERVKRLATACGAVATLDAQHRDENSAYVASLRAAAREAAPPPADKRTTAAQRSIDRELLVDRAWAAAEAVAEAIDRGIGALTEHEDEILSTLHERASVADANRREAARLLQEANAIQFSAERRAAWLLTTVDGKDPLLGKAVAPPESVPAPREWTPQPIARPWHRPRPEVAA